MQLCGIFTVLNQNAAEQYNPLQPVTSAKVNVGGEAVPSPHKSGYLFERKNGRVYQTWSRKYYSIFDGELICTTRNPKVIHHSLQILIVYSACIIIAVHQR